MNSATAQWTVLGVVVYALALWHDFVWKPAHYAYASTSTYLWRVQWWQIRDVTLPLAFLMLIGARAWTHREPQDGESDTERRQRLLVAGLATLATIALILAPTAWVLWEVIHHFPSHYH
jgi:hypothetical protein